MRVYYLVPTRSEWFVASEADSDKFGDLREKGKPFADAPGATLSSATEEGIWEVKPDLVAVHEPLPNDLAQALEETNDSLTTPLVVFDRRALKIPALKSAAISYASRNFENTGFVTVAGEGVSEQDVNAAYSAKKGALPKLHNWKVPSGRNAYVRNVASIVVELEAQLMRRQMEKLVPSGEAIPALSGPGSV
jgi:hypothetical protein